MKRIFRLLLLTAVLTAALCLSAMAADVTAAGFYNVGSGTDITVTPTAASGTPTQCSADVDGTVGTYETFYAGSDKLSVTVKGLTAGEQYLVLLVTGDGQTVTENSICYIDQKSPTGTEVTFDVYPKLPTSTGDMTLIVTGSGDYKRQNVSLGYAVSDTYEVQPYVLGDVNDDTEIDAKDALKVLRAAAELEELSPTQQLAANVNGDSDVDAKDALRILRFAANLITEW